MIIRLSSVIALASALVITTAMSHSCGIDKYFDVSIGTEDDDSCIACPGGRTTHGRTDATRVNQCTCPGGSGANKASLSCEQCHAGTYSTYGPCSRCPGNMYAAEPAMTACDKCEKGTESSEDRTECVDCAAGTYRKSGEYNCKPCPDNQYSLARSHICSFCPAGEQAKTDKDGCEPCPKGFKSSGIEACEQCESGTVSWTEGSTRCEECGNGMKANEDGTACIKTEIVCGNEMKANADGTACIETEIECGNAPSLDNGLGEKIFENTVKFSCNTR